MSFILASASPRRKELLSYLIPEFITAPTDTDETLPDQIAASDAVMELASRKARACAKQFTPQDVIIGSDTVVALENRILGKPQDAAEAKEMLLLLSEKTHAVYTGVCIISPKGEHTFHVKTDVTFMPLSTQEIDAYLATGEPFDKAGAYGIQGYGCTLVKEIHGCYYNVMGLPVAKLGESLKKLSLI